MSIQIFNTGAYTLSRILSKSYTEKIEQAVRLKYASLPKQIEIISVDDTEMESLNHTHRHATGTTDVLSFRLSNEYGQVFISVQQVEKHSKELGTSLKSEIAFVTTHALLHLGGMTHDTKKSYEKMMKITKDILEHLDNV